MTARLRLTLTFAGAFAALGAVLLVISYALVEQSLSSLPTNPGTWLRIALEQQGLGGGVPTGQPDPDLPFGDVIKGVRDALADRALDRLTVSYVLAFLALLAIATLAGWWMAGRALAPVREITSTARRVSQERLGERIALAGPRDELRELADTFDDMLGRLQRGFESRQRFVANASHELRTPLSVIRAEVDVALADPDASREELRAMGVVVREAADRSERLIEALLLLARSEAGKPGDAPVDLYAHARARLENLRDAGGLDVDLTRLEPAVARGEPELLARVVDNLIDNAVAHNVDGGWVRVATWVESGRARLRVANGGAPIDPRDAAQLTEPFRRLGRARVGDGGVGLGLSIVDAIVSVHRGALTLSAPPEGGLVADVALPAAHTA